ncbi:hypothetical protein HD554DRAFT_2189178, partial [Boletus coccyginus]
MSFSPPDTNGKRSPSLVGGTGNPSRKNARTDDSTDGPSPIAEKDEAKPRSTRGARACTACRRRKLKCVGSEQGLPCKRCLTCSRECVFEESNRGKRSSKKHELLTWSVLKMERTLDTVVRSIGNPSMTSGMISCPPSPVAQTAQTQALLQSPSPTPRESSPPQSASLYLSSPKLCCLPDNSLNPLGLLADASLANRRAHGITTSFTARPTDGDADHPPGVASDNYFG